MHLRSLSLAVAFCLSSLPAQALDNADCGMIEEQAFTLLDFEYDIEITQSATSQAQALPDGCASTDLDIYVGSLGLMFRAERLLFTGQNLLEWGRGEVVLPTEFQLRIDGASLMDRPAPQPEFAWIRDLAGPQTPARIDLQWLWQPATGTLDVEALRVEFADGSSATMALRGQAPSWTPYSTPAGDFGLNHLALDLTFNGLFESAVVAPMRAQGIDTSPFTFAMMAAGVQSLTQSAPRSVLSGTSAAAINAFTATLPFPRGRLRLTLDASRRFNLGSALYAMRTGVPIDVALPPGATIQATWTPRP